MAKTCKIATYGIWVPFFLPEPRLYNANSEGLGTVCQIQQESTRTIKATQRTLRLLRWGYHKNMRIALRVQGIGKAIPLQAWTGP